MYFFTIFLEGKQSKKLNLRDNITFYYSQIHQFIGITLGASQLQLYSTSQLIYFQKWNIINDAVYLKLHLNLNSSQFCVI